MGTRITLFILSLRLDHQENEDVVNREFFPRTRSPPDASDDRHNEIGKNLDD
jgi:hypothetical protein